MPQTIEVDFMAEPAEIPDTLPLSDPAHPRHGMWLVGRRMRNKKESLFMAIMCIDVLCLPDSVTPEERELYDEFKRQRYAPHGSGSSGQSDGVHVLGADGTIVRS